MLRNRLFKRFAALVLVFGLLFTVFSLRMVHSRLTHEAQTRVQFNLSSVWAMYNARLREMETILRLVAGKQVIAEVFIGSQEPGGLAAAQSRLEVLRRNFGLDFLTVADAEGRVIMRAAPPYETGDYRQHVSLVANALRGEPAGGTMIMPSVDLRREAEGLAEQAYLAVGNTSGAAPTFQREETRGLVMMAAAPVILGPRVLGAIYGGVLLNRNEALVDHLKEVVFRNELYENRQVGTATIFLRDVRIATTVQLPNGSRALGTRVSKEVAARVLDSGLTWLGPARVLDEWYFSAYDPIRDPDGKTVGMLYVGLLKKPFDDLRRTLLGRYAALMFAGLLGALTLAFVIANQIARPLHRLAEAARQMHEGLHPDPVPLCDASKETTTLILAFNEMIEALAEREARLTEAKSELEQSNARLAATNRSYMETLGFVSHELKSPIASVMNYIYLLREKMLGPLTEKQEKALASMDGSIRRVVEMIRHYLNLSRIESGELQPVRTRLAVKSELIAPLAASFEADIEARNMRLSLDVGEDLAVVADLNMLREVFDNLVSNAIKYGREGGEIWVMARREAGGTFFAVRNEGPGIPPEKQGALFAKFSRLDTDGAARLQRGTGLGLFITKHIVEAHGGRMEVESHPGEWTEFRFVLPDPTPAPDAKGKAA